MHLSILIVSHNSKHYLADCLDSIARFAPSGTEVILADNSSSDGSIEFVAREYSWVRTIRIERNLGFSAANNLAAKEARGRFLLLLNPDTILIAPISPALDWLDSHKNYAAVDHKYAEYRTRPCRLYRQVSLSAAVDFLA